MLAGKQDYLFRVSIKMTWLITWMCWNYAQKMNRICSNGNSTPEVFLGKDILKICSKFTGELPCRRTPMPQCDFNKVALECCRNHTSVWVFSLNLLHIFRTPFYKQSCGGLILITLENFFFVFVQWKLSM